MKHPHRIVPFASVILLFAAQDPGKPAAAQFKVVEGALAGPSYDIKCEGVDVADLDGDGKLDIIFATGFVLQPKRQKEHIPQIQMNKSSGKGNVSFADEAEARLPKDFAVQAGMVTAFDIDRDNDIDLLFAQMGGRQPKLLKNDGKGKFTDVTDAQFPKITLSSASAEFGDVDDDGDLDAVQTDQGKTTRLFINDGKGIFSDATEERMPKIEIVVAQDATFADVDSDFDLDLIVLGKHSKGQNLFLNDGKGKFTDATASLNYPGSGNNYECEWADLDNDGDTDAFWLSISGENEGYSKNLLAETGKLGFTHSIDGVKGHNGDDDNEVSFIDADNDGDLDPIIGSLANATEKLYTTEKDFTFNYAGGFDGKQDPTCDAGVGDFDNDGRVDFVTAQGESGVGNKVYKNTGPADARPPHFTRVESLAKAAGQGPFVFHVFVQDSCYDDGQDFITCSFDVNVEARNGKFKKEGVAMLNMGGHLFRGVIDLAALKAEAPGAKVSFIVKAKDHAGNHAETKAQAFDVAK